MNPSSSIFMCASNTSFGVKKITLSLPLKPNNRFSNLMVSVFIPVDYFSFLNTLFHLYALHIKDFFPFCLTGCYFSGFLLEFSHSYVLNFEMPWSSVIRPLCFGPRHLKVMYMLMSSKLIYWGQTSYRDYRHRLKNI